MRVRAYVIFGYLNYTNMLQIQIDTRLFSAVQF